MYPRECPVGPEGQCIHSTGWGAKGTSVSDGHVKIQIGIDWTDRKSRFRMVGVEAPRGLAPRKSMRGRLLPSLEWPGDGRATILKAGVPATHARRRLVRETAVRQKRLLCAQCPCHARRARGPGCARGLADERPPASGTLRPNSHASPPPSLEGVRAPSARALPTASARPGGRLRPRPRCHFSVPLLR
jgi:hypothetical protein